jgi:hypothetical protein
VTAASADIAALSPKGRRDATGWPGEATRVA